MIRRTYMSELLLLILLLLCASSTSTAHAQMDEAPSFEGVPKIEPTAEAVAEFIEGFVQRGLSGVVFAQLDGRVIHRGAYGFANPDLATPMRADTIFGVGSRPIDFTIASILLLAQREQLALTDSIPAFFDDVPQDKRSMTLLHLLNAQSGLPDFHGTAEDWDQDLAWIDRATAERRILAQPLLFEPGEGDEHSHSAFGLLAAIVERVSGQAYTEFIRENFLGPAKMTRTFEYGQSGGFGLEDFAVGGGQSFVGLPNIPPNWGPTSWLVKGSGGMVSTLDDLIRFYDLLRSGEVLRERYARAFSGASVNFDGSERGFELFSAYDEGGADSVYLFVNMAMPSPIFEELSAALERLVMEN